MKYAEFEVGQVLHAGPYTVTEPEILAFAKQWDPQWFHTQPEAAATGPFNGLIASGWHTCGIAMRLAVDAFLAGSESYVSPGLDNIRWLHPVRPGDTLRLAITIVEKRTTKSGLGLLRWDWEMANQKGDLVLEIKAANLFKI
ncbi:MAG: acyl dehydratase [Comamonas sp. SCN 65-56]|uniref:MaoC family dehydratase n=1 Tax=Comamonas sp. SCN 65-56 TaxID=1660095 RepID=UPI000868F75A|nr:MaoC family dehydratase [Comamonas sp. SCN 65-56]ODS91465.1 MAG: acyl dehydratase [Comamonas sp. SCN 65-56]